MYASLADMRSEGVTPATASDERLTALLTEASAFVDHVTGWFFEPRTMVLRMDGRGTPSVEPPFPPIRVDELLIGGVAASLADDDIAIRGAPVLPGFDAPRFTLLRGCTFPKGSDNVVASGVWGYTEPDGTALGRTPIVIHRAAMLLVMRWLPLLGDAEAAAAKSQWRILEERTRDQSYRLSPPSGVAVTFTSDPEIDLLLARYRKPIGLGAV
ncbi:MAG: hypothetical protein HY898_24975 [Deltaproteobacteria bacterium]|nr:hypothetical protein [Deltaproteobacteria bacterium]